VLRCNNNT